MSPRSYGRPFRIRRRAEFLEVQQRATSRIRTASLLVLARLRPADPQGATQSPLPTRLGVVASRRIGNAVQRNRAKRLIREAFRRCRAELPPSLDLVVIASPSAPGRRLADVEREIARVRRDLRRLFGAAPLAGQGPLG